MIIVNSRAGQRSNRLITIAHAMGTAIERGETLWLTAFGRYAGDYPRLVVSGKCRVLVKESFFWEIVRLWLSVVNRVWRGFKINIPGVITIVSDFTYRDEGNRRKHAEEIRHACKSVNVRQKKYKEHEDEIWVGVHVRRGDYSEWEGGKYFYGDEVYVRVVGELLECLNVNCLIKKVRFMLFSNEDVSGLAKILHELHILYGYSPNNTDVQDQHLMSECDYLIGPPSTFTMWASFMGKVPLLQVERPDQSILLCDFKCDWK